MANERRSLKQTQQIYRDIGLPVLTATAATLITKAMSFIPDCNQGGEELLPSALIWDAIPREDRFYSAEIRFTDPTLRFSPTGMVETLQSTHPDAEVRLQSVNDRPTDAPIVVLAETIDGLPPEDVIKRNNASLLISNGPEGSLVISADHGKYDSVQIIPLVQGMLPYSRREPCQPEATVEGRKIEINRLETGVHDAKQILIAAAAAGLQTRGKKSITCFPILTKSPDHRVLPEFLRNSELAELAGNPFKLFLQKQPDTQLGRAINALDLNKYPPELIAAIYRYLVVNIPKVLIPPISSLVGIGPGRNFKPNDSLIFENPEIGREIRDIGVDFRIYPKHWEIPMLFNVNGKLPNGTREDITINSSSISGATQRSRDKFQAAFINAIS